MFAAFLFKKHTMTYSADIQKLPRHFLPANFTVKNWETLEPYFKDLAERNKSSGADLEKWLKDSSELEAAISEDASWRQIKMTWKQLSISL
jgi:oligoendopeptidase F